jgi:uncharacterized secreted repeat protein (TIGR03808 family)
VRDFDPAQTMDIDRRGFFTLSAAAGSFGASGVMAAPSPAPSLWARGVSAFDLRVEPDSTADQSRALQRAIDQTAAAHVPLVLPPGVYRAADLNLPAGTRLVGCPGASRLLLTDGACLISANGADHLSVADLIFDGGARPLASRSLVHLAHGRNIRIEHCQILGSGGHGVLLEAIEGEVTRSTVEGAAGAAIFSLDARALTIACNTVRNAGNNGILVWRSQKGDDGTLVIDNRIEAVAARDGGSGRSGDAIHVLRAGNVIVRGNRIGDSAFSAVHGSAAPNLQVVGNICSRLKEIALFVESESEGALIADNIVDGAAIGIGVSVAPGGGSALIANNLISGTARGAIIGMERGRPVTEDLAKSGAQRFAQLTIAGNQVR